MEVHEGGVAIEVPEERRGSSEGAGSGVFYNPEQELNRDVTVAVLREWREAGTASDGASGGTASREADQREASDGASGGTASREGAGSYLDAMAASGIRGVRAADTGWDVTCVDVDPDAVALAERNFERNDLEGEVVRADANAHMHGSYYDVVDVDPFGTPIPYVDAAFVSTRSLLCVTATDTAPLCGAHFHSGVRKYGAVPRNTDFHPEMGVRVLLSALARTGARYDVAVEPVLTHESDHYVRTYLALESGATVANEAVEELGYVDWCRECLWREATHGLIADPRESCPHCGADVTTAGPLWLGPAHDAGFVEAVRDRIDDGMGTAKRARKLLDRIAGELHVPTHYDQHDLYEQWGEPAIGMDEFLATLREAGFEASRTHYGGTTVKTTADVGEMADLFA
jgi:tRNA (guanine26-N2/guanine27-N2)-dimethyltransferase